MLTRDNLNKANLHLLYLHVVWESVKFECIDSAYVPNKNLVCSIWHLHYRHM